MKCPDPGCGRRASALETRSYKGGVRRHYRCEQGHRFTTLEQVAQREGQRLAVPTPVESH